MLFIPHVWGDVLVLQWGVMVGAVISHIISSRCPIVTELIMILPAADLVEAHIHSFGAFGDNVIVCDPSFGRFFCLEGL